MMEKPLVLLTGATGYIGFAILRDLLSTFAYKVRLVVRSGSKLLSILANPVIKDLLDQTLEQDRPSFEIVPDFLAPNAFDHAVRECNYIIHVASAMPDMTKQREEDPYETFIEPTVKGSLCMLEAAAKSATVRRIIVTSSIFALAPFEPSALTDTPPPAPDQGGPKFDFTADSRIPTQGSNYQINGSVDAYWVAKVTALNKAEAWMRAHESELQFDLIHVFPSVVLGRATVHHPPQPATILLNTSNTIPLAIALAKSAEDTTNRFTPVFVGNTVHISDVATIHIRLLDEKLVPVRAGGVDGFIAHGTDVDFDDAREIIRRRFPRAVEEGVLPNRGVQGTLRNLRFDQVKVMEMLGIDEWKGFEEQVVDVVGQYVEMADEEMGGGGPDVVIQLGGEGV